MTQRKGIIVSGGSGTRLYPITMGVSKPLLPIYDKPMVYNPLTVLMITGTREVMVITTLYHANQIQSVLDDGSQWSISLQYKAQSSPDGQAQVLFLAKQLLANASVVVVLANNIFYNHSLLTPLHKADKTIRGVTTFTYHLVDFERRNIMNIDIDGKVKSIIEKPYVSPSNLAMTRLYLMDKTALQRAKNVRPSGRSELEITSLLKSYPCDAALSVQKMGSGFNWIDAGTHDSLFDAKSFVRTLTEWQGAQVGSPDQVALDKGWIGEVKQKIYARKIVLNVQ